MFESCRDRQFSQNRRSRTLFQQRLEIRAGALRFVSGGLGGFAEAEIAVDQAQAIVIAGWNAGGGKPL